MSVRRVLHGTLCAAALAASAPASAAEDASRAWQNWTLNCQGCHRPDGSGTPGGAPRMPGVVGRFLWTPEGRDYLTRVPGVATAPLPDDQLAELLNYVLRHYDGPNLPRAFRPYTAADIAEGRRRILRTDAAAARRALISKPPSEGAELQHQPQGGR
jgi:mono/diheme cytochrome c family protein